MERKTKRTLLRLYRFSAPFVLGCTITVASAFIIQILNEGVEYLDFTVEQTAGVLKGLREVNTGSRFYIDNNNIDDFSILTINIFNNSGQNYENVPVSVLLDCKRSDVLSLSHYDKTGAIDRVIPLEDSTGSKVRYVFTHKVVNDLGSNLPVASIRLVLRGNSIPSYWVDTEYKGLEIKLSEGPSRFTSLKYWEAFIIGYLLTMLVLLYFRHKAVKSDNERLSNRLDRVTRSLDLYRSVLPNVFSQPTQQPPTNQP